MAEPAGAGARRRPATPGCRDPVVRLFQVLLGLTFIVAWASLGAQVDVLLGRRGLLPARELSEALASRPELGFFDVPTIFRADASDAALHAGIWVGLLLAGLVVAGIVPRVALAASTLLYLSYAVVARSFLAFQWDNLLLECGALGALLPTRRRSAWAHFLLKVLLFKLYFESGIAKYESHLGDWKDGSAMAYYYETAPIPTRLAWYAHHLPAAYHALESRATLAFEIVVPFAIFGPRRARLVALAIFTGFQLVNIATANYGFFSYLALVLSVFLLDAQDVRRARTALSRVLPSAFDAAARGLARVRITPVLAARRARRAWAKWRARGADAASRGRANTDAATLRFLLDLSAAAVLGFVYVGVSLQGALGAFVPEPPPLPLAATLAELLEPFRIVNTYHLFGHITRERIEPTFETFDGTTWTPLAFHYKPGPVDRPPPFVAPHQPRVDFLLWFYGLSAERGVPTYVRALLDRLCRDPAAVAGLFVTPPPDAPQAVRVSFYRYHFTTAEERRRTGAWWTRHEVYEPRTLPCNATGGGSRSED
jgi:hypothetical protein